MLKAVLFDLDGTVIDSEPQHSVVALCMLRERSVDLPEGGLDRYIGIPGSVMWRELRERYSLIESVVDLLSCQHKMNIEMLEKGGCILVPGIAELLRKLRRRKIRAAIASSSTREYILAALAAHGLESWFDQVVSSEEVPRGKPRPDVFLRAAEVLGVRPEDCVIIEDSDNGLAAAREAGIRSIGFRNPNSGCQSLALADRIVDSVREIRMGMLASLAGGMRGG